MLLANHRPNGQHPVDPMCLVEHLSSTGRGDANLLLAVLTITQLPCNGKRRLLVQHCQLNPMQGTQYK